LARSLAEVPEVTLEIAFVLALILVALVFFVKEWYPPDSVALLVLASLVISGVLTPQEAFSGFGNEALLTVASMFILAAGLIRTGTVTFVGRRILAFGGTSEVRILLTLMLACATCSSVINNTPIVVIFLPITLGISEATGIRASKLLIPVSYATIVGGMCTLIGTSTNVLISTMLPRFHLPPMHMFEPLPLALAGIAMTMTYMVFVGRRILPRRTTVTSSLRAGKISDYVTELELPPGSPLAGKTVAEAFPEGHDSVRVLQLIRGEEILSATEPAILLESGDMLIVKGDVNALLSMQRAQGLTVAPGLASPALEARSKDLTLAELLVRPASSAIGEVVRDLNLRARHGVVVLAVQRHGVHIRQKVADLHLRLGDVLLIQADAEALTELRDSRQFVLLEGIQEQVLLTHRAGFALAVVAGVVALATLEIANLPMSMCALLGAVLMVAGGCLSVRDAYRAIDLPLLVLIAGTISLGMAMEKSGAARWIASGLVGAAASLGDLGLLSAIYLITNVLTALISNNAAALLMLPIAIATAHASGLNPQPFIMSIMFAASIDFSTPIGYQTNTIIYGPGGYRFSDYVKVGVPLNLLWWLLATLLIPVFWPLRPA
jgi:di/tricarboxylate transporter